MKVSQIAVAALSAPSIAFARPQGDDLGKIDSRETAVQSLTLVLSCDRNHDPNYLQ